MMLGGGRGGGGGDGGSASGSGGRRENEFLGRMSHMMMPPPLQLSSPAAIGGDDDEFPKRDERVPQWSHQETRDFIAIRAELERDFTVAKRNKTLWEVVSTRMKELGYRRSADQCKCKWKNLVNRYKIHLFLSDRQMHQRSQAQAFNFFENKILPRNRMQDAFHCSIVEAIQMK